jgi:polar amino acid transport system substrate-binding protein
VNRGVILLLLAASLSFPAASARAEQTIRIATEGAYPPFNYVDNNEPAGFEIELARALCAAMHATCTFQIQDWDGMISGLRESRYDAIVSSMEITPEREKKIAFSVPYYRVPSALVGPLATPPLNGIKPADLAEKSVGTVVDSEFASYLEDTIKDVSVRKYDKLDEAELDLLTGRIDYVLGDKLALQSFLESREGKGCCHFIADAPVDRGEGVGIGLRKADAALRDGFNAAIAQVERDGTYDGIRAKYFPFDIK